MPELPEVEITRRNLARWTESRRIVAVTLPDPAAVRTHLSTSPRSRHPDAQAWVQGLVGMCSLGVDRVGKRLAWRLSGASALLHLGMTGKWVLRVEEVPRHGRLGLRLDDGATVWFVDSRRFGCVVPVQGDAGAALRDGLGSDALDDPLGGPDLGGRLVGRRAIKTALLDQRLIAGVGNIQAAEALWRAGIAPRSRCEDVSPAAWVRLARELPAQLARVIREEESDEIAYLTSEGGRNPFEVYGREGEPCPRCGSPIVRDRVGGRVDFSCSSCQPINGIGPLG